MTQVVAKYDEQSALQAWGNAKDEPWEDDGNSAEEPLFPIIKIVQPTSTMKGAERHIGEFYHPDLDIYAPEIECVALVRRDTRAYFPEGSDAPLCRSDDGTAPAANQRLWDEDHQNTPQPQFCEQCPFSVWENDRPPACNKSIVVLIDRGDGDLAQLRIGGKSIRPFTQFVRSKLVPKRLPMFSQRLVLATEIKSEASKKWAELVIESQTMTPTEALKFNHILQDQRRRFEESVAADGGRVEAWTDHAIPNENDLPFE